MSVAQWSLRWGLETIGGVLGGPPLPSPKRGPRARVEMSFRSSRVTVTGRDGKALTRWFRHDTRGLNLMAAMLRLQPRPRKAVVAGGTDAGWMADFVREKCGYEDVRLGSSTEGVEESA